MPTPDSFPNGYTQASFGPPPSTMAAQLISNLATNNKPSREPEQDDLKRLMSEVSELENNLHELKNGDVMMEHKHKLIYVFARAVLERLRNDDPFINLVQLVSQASEALEIFISAIRDTPAVLGYVSKEGSSLRKRGQEPLWIWLFPRVLTLLGRRGCEALTERIKAFFRVCFKMVSRTPKLWHLNSDFFTYMKECISVILVNLQNPAIIPQGTMSKVALPSEDPDFILLFYRRLGHSDTESLLSYNISEATHAIWHVHALLSLLVDISIKTADSYDATPEFQNYMAWILDSYFASHEMQKRWKSTSSLQDACNGSDEKALSSVHALLSSLENSMPDAITRKGYVILSIFCADMLGNPSEAITGAACLSICRSILKLTIICQRHDAVYRAVSLHLLPTIKSYLGNPIALGNLGNDLKKTALTLCGALNVEVESISEFIVSDSYDSAELSAESLHLGIEIVASREGTDGPPPKRRKLQESKDIFDDVVTDLYSLLGTQMARDLSGLSQLAEPCFSALNNSDRCKAIECLARIPCASYGTLSVKRNPDGTIQNSSCSLCEEHQTSASIYVNSTRCQSISSEAIATFGALIKSAAVLDSKRPRVLAMFALRNFATHFEDQSFLDLEMSDLGQWCVASLRSSIRELRVATGRTLVAFLRHRDSAKEVTRKNRFNVIELLRAYSEEPIHLQETIVLAWGQVGRISDVDELNIVLLRLVTYLGHSNPVISSVAFNEILNVSKAAGITVERMFSPYWDTVAIEAVKDLLVRPQITQLIADLIGISVSEFLILTQTFTLPWLVSSGKPEIIKRIGDARKDPDGWLVCLETSNMVAILPHLLTQRVSDVEHFVRSRIGAISSQFEEIDFADLLRVEPASQAFHLLKSACEADEAKKARIQFAFKTLATHSNTAGERHRNQDDLVGRFLEQHLLGLVARFSEVVNDSRDEQPIKEKERCIKAFEELVKTAKTYARTARPQICACLQSSLANRYLQASALTTWKTILMNLEDSDVAFMLESTFSMIIQHWNSFKETTKACAEETLQYLVTERGHLIRNAIVNLPSLEQFTELAAVESKINDWRQSTDVGNAFQIYSRRISHENSAVVVQALVELKEYLESNQDFLQLSAISEQPDPVVGVLVRSILDTCVRFDSSNQDITTLSAECVGLIGCLDSNRVESVREQRDMVVVTNFEDAGETTDFVLFILEEVIVKAFLSADDTIWQGFLSYVMQELLRTCDFRDIVAPIIAKTKSNTENPVYRKWCNLPFSVQNTLTPFLTSKFLIHNRDLPKYTYPIFTPDTMISDKIYNTWLRAFVLDLLQNALNYNTSLIFPPLSRAIRIKDISIASFLLPYVALHVILLGTDQQRQNISEELLRVLTYEIKTDSKVRWEDMKLCIEAVFRVLNYCFRWRQEKMTGSRGGNLTDNEQLQLQRVESFAEMIPSEIISQRAVECRSYSRALFYWEQHIRASRDIPDSPSSKSQLLQRLQDIYTQIDEPDGIEGISAQLHVLDIEQQILGHRKAGRWTAAQSWYEIKLAEDPDNVNVQVNLLTCLKESGQHDVLLNYVEGMRTATETASRLLPFATEASWATGRWQALRKYTSMAPQAMNEDFNVRIGQALLALHAKDDMLFQQTIQITRKQVAGSMSVANTASLGSSHDNRLKLHVLTELEMIAGTGSRAEVDRPLVLASLHRRLEVIGAYLNDKQYLLGIRRAAMQLSSSSFTEGDIASAWLTSARLARKGNAMHQSFNAVLHASQLKDDSATIEHARLLWKEGHHRKAIQNLRTAIENNTFISHNRGGDLTSLTGVEAGDEQNFLTARAHLLLAKWLDSAGQTHSLKLRQQYQLAARTHSKWEKGHYYLGRHYNKLLETERNFPAEAQSEKHLTGETAKLVIENYLRSLMHGTKYLYQTLPRILTLWLELGTQLTQPVDPRHGNTREFVAKITDARKDNLGKIHVRFNTYISKMPAYMFYTALPQIVARIAHPNPDVFRVLSQIIYKVCVAHPQQALWSLFAVCASTQQDRKTRGAQILQTLRVGSSKKSDPGMLDIKTMIKCGERLSDQLLLACNAGDFQGNRTTHASLSKDLGFNLKSAMLPNPMAVPAERVLTATLPTLTNNIAGHKAFSRDIVTVTAFSDKVLVLSSLQKPRKLDAIGSDGNKYGLMCKPKDDLRKDQRLMEFNSMINRALKRDAEASRRQLYIKTYAVTPLNEECGLIEWVNGLKTLRDILLGLYKSQGIGVNYREIEAYCEQVTSDPNTLPWFTKKVLGNFPPVFHMWFVQQFPDPSAWFTARLRYTRSCAVMSMVGTMLGLGDRHGENILFEEGNGGTFHVDFNCLFEKGLTFAKPERVPFRLTHNMVDAMGIYGYEGPFRKSSELTLKLLRQHQETLMTILEAFIYDPTLDLLKKTEKKKKEGVYNVPQTAQGVLTSIQRKLKGLLPGESVPLGVEGQVDELIQQATNQAFLAGMYIGWCSFF